MDEATRARIALSLARLEMAKIGSRDGFESHGSSFARRIVQACPNDIDMIYRYHMPSKLSCSVMNDFNKWCSITKHHDWSYNYDKYKRRVRARLDKLVALL